MDYSQVVRNKENKSVPARVRLFLWRFAQHRQRKAIQLDRRSAPEHLLRDLGISSPNQAWEETVAFWR